MNISVCITVLNEETSVGVLLNSLVNQSKHPTELIIVDGGSSDNTVGIIQGFRKRKKYIKLIRKQCARAEGRNIGVRSAKSSVIAITDAGCVANRFWLERLSRPFTDKSVDIVAGFYKMKASNPLQVTMASFLGVLPKRFDNNFLPSTRSIAFRKKAWLKIKGFPEESVNSAEDTYFNCRSLKLGLRYTRVKGAVVEWGMPKNIVEFFNKIRSYAMWDAKSKIFLFPGKGLKSHNVKAILVVLRYFVGGILLYFAFTTPLAMKILIAFLLAYLLFAFRKGGFWGIVLQFVSDFAVIIGFTHGILSISFQRH
jgi:glycosyltransferase involved in cell wall biosynthesis